MRSERGLVLVLEMYVAVSAGCVLLGVAALVYRTLGHRCDVGALGPVLVIIAASATAAAGARMLAVLHRRRRACHDRRHPTEPMVRDESDEPGDDRMADRAARARAAARRASDQAAHARMAANALRTMSRTSRNQRQHRSQAPADG